MPCITLLSDLGLQDASVASVKGILMQHNPGTMIIDISHQVEPFHLQQAAYLLNVAYRNFEKGTCHILLFDVFSEPEPRLLLCEKEDHFFLAPDNGVLSLAFGDEFRTVWRCYELRPPDTFQQWIHACGKYASGLFEQGIDALDLERCEMKVAPLHWQPVVYRDSVECHVIHIDRFENVVVNLTRNMYEEVGKGRDFRIKFMRDDELTTLSSYYFNVAEGDVLCRFNSTGYLEISINRGKAASLLGFQLLNSQHFMYNTIKIYFE